MALPEDLSKLRVVDLKEELTKRNLPTKGKKDELIARLQEALDQTGDNSAEGAAEATTEQTAQATEEKASEPEKEEVPHSTKPITEVVTIESVTDDTAPPSNPWPNDLAVEDNSSNFQGATEKAIEHDHSPVITKESGFVDPEATVVKMDLEDERGLKRKVQDNASDEVKRSKTDVEVNRSTAQLEPSSSNLQQVTDMQQPDNAASTETEESSMEKVSHESESKPVDSNAVYIKGFVRPLILRHAEELAKKYGTVKKFWMDSIKTHCYVIYETSEEANAAYKNIDNTVFPPDTGRTLHVGALSESKAEEMIVLEKEAVEKRIKFDWELAIQELPNVIAPPAASDEPKATEETASPGARKSRLGGIEQVSRQLQRAAADTEKSSSDIMRRQPVEALTTASLRANTVKVLSLDELFKKTKTLPALYYQPVSEEIASKRLEHMHSYSAVNN